MSPRVLCLRRLLGLLLPDPAINTGEVRFIYSE